MINAESCFLDCINSPVRKINGRVELYNNSTLLKTFKHTDKLKSFTVERVAEEGKFFGFGVCQKLTVKLIDSERELNITTDHRLEAVLGTGCDYVYPFPLFKVSRVVRDELTNELSITAYDAIYEADKHTFSELNIKVPYTTRDLAIACANLLGVPFGTVNIEDASFDTVYYNGVNLDGTETIREILNAIAESTQSIYYLNNEWQLTFKRLDNAGEAVYTVDQMRYFELDSGENRRLAAIVHTTELGDNIKAALSVSGSTQYVRNNPFWELRQDIGVLVENALAAVGGLTINQFNCKWRGNYLLEIGDKIALITKDNDTVYSFLLDDVIEYNGALNEETQWIYNDDSEEEEANPSSIGDAIKQTYAKVDKVNRQIDLMVSDISLNAQEISNLKITTNEINATVSNVSSETSEAISGIGETVNTLTSKVEASITAEDVSLQISRALDNGVDKVETSTGFTFNEEGLTVSKSGSEMTTTITEDGMTVFRDSEAVLIADNEGVKAEDLHATTYLIVGNNSRFEDYGSRTGCFWIGE